MVTIYEDRRRYVRREVGIPITCSELSENRSQFQSQKFQTVTSNISVGGMAFESSYDYPPESVLLTDICLPDEEPSLLKKMRVVRSQPLPGETGFLVGVEFAEETRPDQDRMERYLESLNFLGLLDEMCRLDASDLHLTVGRLPVVRIQRKIRSMGTYELQPGQIEVMLYPYLKRPEIELFLKKKELNFSLTTPTGLRFRVNMHFQKGMIEATIRHIPNEIRGFAELGLPVFALEQLCQHRSGLVLITGKAGSGKTTTLASMVDYINKNMDSVIITVEDPIEYVHVSQKCVVKQREVGRDTESSAAALRNALRQDPDVVVIGELLDSDSVMEAICAAETGHLVFATVHAPGAVQALERIVNLFPIDLTSVICKKLSGCLNGMLSQVLVPGKQGGAVLATELLVLTPALKNIIREGIFEQIGSYLQTGKELGMHTLQSSLNRLADQNLINRETIEYYTNSKTE